MIVMGYDVKVDVDGMESLIQLDDTYPSILTGTVLQSLQCTLLVAYTQMQ